MLVVGTTVVSVVCCVYSLVDSLFTCKRVRGSSAFTPCLEHVRAGGGSVANALFHFMRALGIILSIYITPNLYDVTL